MMPFLYCPLLGVGSEMGNPGHMANLAVNKGRACGVVPSQKHSWFCSLLGNGSHGPTTGSSQKSLHSLSGSRGLAASDLGQKCPKAVGSNKRWELFRGCRWKRRAQGEPRCLTHPWDNFGVMAPLHPLQPSCGHGEGLQRHPPKSGSHSHD